MGLDVTKAKDLLGEINQELEKRNRHVREIFGVKILNDYDKIDDDIVYKNFLCIQYRERFVEQKYDQIPRSFEVQGYCIKYVYDSSTGTKFLHLWDDELFVIPIGLNQPCNVREIKHPSETQNEENSGSSGSCSAMFV